jgi:hypothetical protein
MNVSHGEIVPIIFFLGIDTSKSGVVDLKDSRAENACGFALAVCAPVNNDKEVVCGREGLKKSI